MGGDGRDWLAAQPLPATAREQITVALAMIDALDVQIAPWTASCAPTRAAQTGCKALIDAYYGIGELVAVTVVAELGDCRRFSNSRDAVRYGGHGHHRLPIRPPPRARASVPPGAAGAALGAVRGRAARPIPAAPTATTTCRPRSISAATAPAWRSRASCSSAATTRCASSATTPSRQRPPEEAG